jgi:DNA-binding response OmpR family regulator
MTKPLVPARIVERLQRVVRWLVTQACTGADRAERSGGAGLEKTGSLLIVDGNAEFRDFFAEVLSPKRTVLTADTGTRGFRMCLESSPAAMFIGSALGVLNDALLVRKIRSSPAMQGRYLVAVADSQEEAASRVAGYDGTILRTRQPEELLKQLESLSGRGAGVIQRLLAVCPELTGLLAASGEQVLGMTLSTEMSIRDGALLPIDRLVVSARGKWGDEDGLRLHGCCDVTTARQMAAHLLGIDPGMVHDEDVDAGGTEVLSNILDRFCKALNAKQVPIHFDAPPVVRRCTGEASPPAEDLVAVCLQSASGDARCWLMLEDEEHHPDEHAADSKASEAA